MKIFFEPRDIWVGVYWTVKGRVTTLENDYDFIHVYVCIVPCFPIYFTIKRSIPKHNRHLNW